MVEARHTEKEISLKELTRRVISIIRFLFKSWKWILTFAILGAIVGCAYALLKKPRYIAVVSFVTDSDQQGESSLSNYAGLAARFGLDLGAEGSNNSIFFGDNIYDLLQTRRMLQSTLLSPVEIAGKKTLLIDRYIQIKGLRHKWKSKAHYRNISFDTAATDLSRYQNDVIQQVCRSIATHNLGFPGKSASDNGQTLMKVSLTSEDEQFSFLFLNKLIDNVAQFYVSTQTKRTRQHLALLSKQLDSVRNQLYGAMSNVATFEDQNLNLVRQGPRVQQQKSSIRMDINSSIYQQLVSAVETARLELLKETPLFEIIDKPILPLEKKRPNVTFWAICDGFVGVFLTIAFLLGQRFYRYVRDDTDVVIN